MGFEIDAFDGALPLIIDPLVSYSNYLGGAAQSAVTGVAVDSAGNLYATGWTQAFDFPIVGAYQGANHGSADAFVVKLNASGSALIYATYIGALATIVASASRSIPRATPMWRGPRRRPIFRWFHPFVRVSVVVRTLLF